MSGPGRCGGPSEGRPAALTGPDRATLMTRSTIDVTISGSRNTWRLESTAAYVKVGGRWLSGDSRSQML